MGAEPRSREGFSLLKLCTVLTGPFMPWFWLQADPIRAEDQGRAEPEDHFPRGCGLPGSAYSSLTWSGRGYHSMDPSGRWRNLPSGPSLKHLTDPSYRIPRAQQKAALQELTRAHVDSFNYAVCEGLSQAVQVIAASPGPRRLRIESGAGVGEESGGVEGKQDGA